MLVTRRKTGVGVPQLSAIIECADGAHGVNGCIVGDGGITSPGDLAKAFGGGADFVMIGGQFAGHDENPGELEEKDGKKYKLFYGIEFGTCYEKTLWTNGFLSFIRREELFAFHIKDH